MTTQPQPQSFTAEEFIDWAMAQLEGRYELDDGAVVRMASERVGHVRAKLAAVLALRDGIRASGLECEAMTDGMAVRIDDRTVYEPDALVRCGPRLPGETVLLTDPTIVVEVLSPSTVAIDSGRKLFGYFRLPGVRHYLLVDPERRAVAHHRLEADGQIATRILRAGLLTLDPPGITVDIGDFFAGL